MLNFALFVAYVGYVLLCFLYRAPRQLWCEDATIGKVAYDGVVRGCTAATVIKLHRISGITCGEITTASMPDKQGRSVCRINRTV